MTLDAQSGPVGLIAGWGNFPLEVAERIRSTGRPVCVVAIQGHADPRLEQVADAFEWKGVLKLGSHLKFFSQAGVKQVVMAGKIFKSRILHHGRGWIDHLPDFTCCRLFYDIFLLRKRDGRDDTLLNVVVSEYEKQGMKILPITEVAPGLLVDEGCLTKGRPKRKHLADAQFGWRTARSMGALDVGQSITVKDQMVLGVEAIEGTDALIERSGKLCPRGGFSLIKLAKPNQDMRFDVPTIGLRTVEQMILAGGKSIVVEAGRTILLDREATLKKAEQHGISIVAMKCLSASNPNQNAPVLHNEWNADALPKCRAEVA